MSIWSSGALYADVIEVKSIVNKKYTITGKDTQYFAMHKNSVQVAGSDEDKGFVLLAGTLLFLGLIIGAAALTIHK